MRLLLSFLQVQESREMHALLEPAPRHHAWAASHSLCGDALLPCPLSLPSVMDALMMSADGGIRVSPPHENTHQLSQSASSFSLYHRPQPPSGPRSIPAQTSRARRHVGVRKSSHRSPHAVRNPIISALHSSHPVTVTTVAPPMPRCHHLPRHLPQSLKPERIPWWRPLTHGRPHTRLQG